ncbi:diaminopimelate decarboxylase [Orbaceae bacterium ac157xtp]
MNFIHYKDGILHAHDVAISQLVELYGTPLYVYSEDEIAERFIEFKNALANTPHLICYAMKANSNLAIIKMLAELGAGFDIVSQGELERVLKAGGDMSKVVFSGVAKTDSEIARALDVGIKCFNVESEAELENIQSIAERMGKIANISLRINPDVDAKTHPYISTGLSGNKFGISYQIARQVYQKAHKMPNIKIVGIDAHIGSQLTELAPFLDSADRLLLLVEALKEDGITIEHIDFGGGLGVCYNDETPPTATELVTELKKKLANYPYLEIIFEPGRSLVANAGLLVTKVEYIKHHEGNHFAIVDAGMNALIRPALYESWMKILPVIKPKQNAQFYDYDVVGPVCESSCFLGKKRHLAVTRGDLLVVCGAGAYGFSMSSNYNSQPRAAEVMVTKSTHRLIRKRESFDMLWQDEII